MIKDNSVKAKALTQVLQKYQKKHYNADKKTWSYSSIDFKNLMNEVWDLSKKLNKNKK